MPAVMFGLASVISSPLEAVNNLFDDKMSRMSNESAPLVFGVKEFFSKYLETLSDIEKVPLLNSTPLHYLKSNTLVRYRGMIQDTFDPEHYLGSFEVVNTCTLDRHMRTGKFQDDVEIPPDYEIDFDSPRNVHSDRLTMYVVPIPGESEWARNAFPKPDVHNDNEVCCSMTSEDDTPRGLKRQCETDESTTSLLGDRSKRQMLDGNNNNIGGEVGASGVDLCNNFPLRHAETGIACIIKAYDHDSESYRVGNMVEFIGILCIDHPLAENATETGISSLLDEDIALYRSASIVPRLHVISHSVLSHSNPLLSRTMPSENTGSILGVVGPQIHDLRHSVLRLFADCLGGDELAAEYYLYNIISRVHQRHAELSLGKFSINISGMPKGAGQAMHSMLADLLPKVASTSLTISNCNSVRFIPKKDFNKNILVSGLLQLSAGTHLIVDETTLESGQLNENGLRNIQALQYLLKWQKIPYDFEYYQVEFSTDIQVAIFSEAKSMFNCDVHIPLPPGAASRIPTDHEALRSLSSVTAMTPELLHRLRYYLGAVVLLPYDIPGDVVKHVEDDFIVMRKKDPINVTGDTLHSLLSLARLRSLSFGEEMLSVNTWTMIKRLEAARQSRLA